MVFDIISGTIFSWVYNTWCETMFTSVSDGIRMHAVLSLLVDSSQ